MPKFTDKQQQIIDVNGKNVLVSASAGSGKTTVMIERIITKVKNENLNIKDFLVVTFTNAAAEEMKLKIYNKFKKEAKEFPALAEQLEDVLNSDISTIHGFCQKIIKKYFYEIGVDPSFKILQGSETAFLKQNAFNSVFDKWMLKDDLDFFNLLESYNTKRSHKEFRELIERIYGFLKSKHNYMNWANTKTDELYNLNLTENTAVSYLAEIIEEELDYYKDRFKKLLEKSKMLEVSKGEVICEEVINFVNAFINAPNNNNKITILQESTKFTSARKGKLEAEQLELMEKISEAKKAFSKYLTETKKLFGKDITLLKEDLIKARDSLKLILNFIEDYDKEYAKLKFDISALDFSDLEHFCLQILQNKNIAKEVRESYEYVFVDEYQDTNNLQENIISLVAKTDNSFMVGDVKQSIYMFRQCDPQIFVDKYHLFKEQEKKGQVFDLNKNFRSDSAVLDFCNHIFNNIMTDKTASVDYKNSAKFVAGLKMGQKPENVNVEVNILNVNKEEDEKNNKTAKAEAILDFYSVKNAEIVEKLTDTELEAELIENKITELLNSEIYDAEIENFRRVDYKDIAILTRNRDGYLKTVCKKLVEKGVPLTAEYSYNIYKEYEIELIHNYLKLINNFDDSIALASVLTSTIVGLSLNDLAEIVNKTNKKDFATSLLTYISENKQDKITERVNKLIEDLKEFEYKKTYLDVKSLLQEVLAKYNLHNYFVLLPGGRERIKNIELLLSECKSNKENTDLFKYLKYVEESLDSKDFKIKISNGENSVNITTSHSSKGLEYPVVLLIGCGRTFSNQSKSGNIVLNKDLGIGLNSYDLSSRTKSSTIAIEAVKQRIEVSSVAEEMRLFYVALTRAKNKLVLVGKTDVNKVNLLNSNYLVRKAKNYLDWILGSLSKEGLGILKTGKENLRVKTSENNSFNINLFTREDLKKEEDLKQVNPIIFSKKNDKYSAALASVFNSVYKNKVAEGIVLKNTVTGIVNKANEEDEPVNYSIKKFRLSEKEDKTEIDFSEIGTLYHSIMEKVSFDVKDMESLKQNIESLIKQKSLPENILEVVELKKVLTAINKINEFAKAAKTFKEEQFMMYIPYNKIFIGSNVEDKILIQGIIDYVAETENEVYLIDYKTSRLKKETDFVNKYKTQLDVYALAMSDRFIGKTVKKIIYSFYLDSVIIV